MGYGKRERVLEKLERERGRERALVNKERQQF